jgi:hypothetical protein
VYTNEHFSSICAPKRQWQKIAFFVFCLSDPLMKYIIVFLLLLPLCAKPQDIHFVNGPKLDYYDNETFEFIGADADKLFVTYDKGPDHYLATYDKNELTQISEVKIPFPDPGIFYLKIDLVLTKDMAIALYRYNNYADTLTIVEMRRFNYDGTQIDQPMILSKIRGKKSNINFNVFNNTAQNEFILQSGLLLKDQILWQYDHFDYNGDKKNSQTHSFNMSHDHFLYSVIDDEYSSYLLSKDRSRNRANYNLQIFNPATQTTDSLPLPLLSTGNYFLNNFFESATDRDNNIVIICPYGEGYQEPAIGLYLIKINSKTKKLLAEKIIRFVKNRAEEEDFSLNSCIPVTIETLTDNSLRVIFESREEIKTQVYGINVGKEYNIDNIVTVDLDSNFSPVEMHKIKKQQHTNTEYFEYTGFVIMKNNNQSFYIYNELPENLELAPDKMKKVKSFKFDETVVIQTTVLNNSVRRKKLMDKSTGSLVDAIIPRKNLDTGNGKISYVIHRINENYYITKFYLD